MSYPYTTFALLYDKLLGDRFFARARHNFERLRQRFGLHLHSAADVACGTGTFVKYLAGLGLRRVYGVDRSAEMLALAIAKNHGNNACFLLQDLKNLSLPQPVDLITCNFDSLNYLLTPGHLLHALRMFHNNLKPDGCLVFDMITLHQPWRGPGPWIEQARWNGFIFQRRMEIAPLAGLQKSLVRISRNGHTSQEIHMQRVYPIRKVVDLIKRATLLPVGVHDFYSLGPPTNTTRRVVYVARNWV